MAAIPPHATCVFKGVVFDVYQWQQTLFDGTTATFEGLKRAPTVFVLALQGDEVLFARQEQPNKGAFASLFGGGAEAGETPLEAAQRELREESGLTSPRWALLRTYHSIGKVQHEVHLFVAYDCVQTHPQDLDAGERITLARAKLASFLPELLAQPDFYCAELKREIYSSYNPTTAEALLQDIARHA